MLPTVKMLEKFYLHWALITAQMGSFRKKMLSEAFEDHINFPQAPFADFTVTVMTLITLYHKTFSTYWDYMAVSFLYRLCCAAWWYSLYYAFPSLVNVHMAVVQKVQCDKTTTHSRNSFNGLFPCCSHTWWAIAICCYVTSKVIPRFGTDQEYFLCNTSALSPRGTT